MKQLRWSVSLQAWIEEDDAAPCDRPPVQRGPTPRSLTISKIPLSSESDAGWYEIRFAFHAAFLWEMKREIPGSSDPARRRRRWIESTTSWRIHPDYSGVLKKLIRKHFKEVIVSREPGRADRIKTKDMKSGNIADTSFAPAPVKTESSLFDDLFCGRTVTSAESSDDAAADAGNELDDIKDIVTVEEDL